MTRDEFDEWWLSWFYPRWPTIYDFATDTELLARPFTPQPGRWVRDRIKREAKEKEERERPVAYRRTVVRQLRLTRDARSDRMMDQLGLPRGRKLTAEEVERVVSHVAAKRGARILRRVEMDEAARQRLAKRVLAIQLRQQAAQLPQEPPSPVPPDVQRKRVLNWWDYRKRLARNRAQAK